MTRMVWTKDVPTELGPYWYRDEKNEPEICCLVQGITDVHVFFFSHKTTTTLMCLIKYREGGEWCRVPEPEEG